MIALARLLAALLCLAGAALAGAYALALASAPGEGAARLFPAQVHKTACQAGRVPCAPALAWQAGARAPLGARALSDLLASPERGSDPALARLVLSQDPRAEHARILMAEAALREGDMEGFLRLYLPVFQTHPRQAAAYADALAALSVDEDLFTRIEARIGEAPPSWGGAWLAALARRGDLPASRLIGLYARFPQSQAGLLSQMTASGNWHGAYIAFNAFLAAGPPSAEEANALTIPFNPRFQALPAPPPFNWRLNGQGAEWLPEGGVYAFFQGRRSETFLSQTFPLQPGPWRLSARMSGDVSETGGYFRFVLACAGSGKKSDIFDVTDLTAYPGVREFDFEHPAGICDFVTLSLTGVPGTFPQPARIELTEARLVRLDAGQVLP